jgi:hypothetical protein
LGDAAAGTAAEAEAQEAAEAGDTGDSGDTGVSLKELTAAAVPLRLPLLLLLCGAAACMLIRRVMSGLLTLYCFESWYPLPDPCHVPPLPAAAAGESDTNSGP